LKSLAQYGQDIKNILRTTPIEVLLLGVLGAASAGFLSYHHESNKSKVIPIAFSELTQIEKIAQKQNGQTPPITNFLASTNDLTMKVFECWNLSHERTFYGNNNRPFAQELENKIDPSMKIHKHEIPDLAQAIPLHADQVVKTLAQQQDTLNKIRPINRLFDLAWDEDHDDVYHTEMDCQDVTTTDADGDVTSTEVCTPVQVYDYTIHTYTYRKVDGEKAAQELETLLSARKELLFPEQILTAKETQADNEYAIEKSRRKKEHISVLTPIEYISFANTWAHGSTIKDAHDIAQNRYAQLHGDSVGWNSAKKNAKSTQYKTYSSSDAGPREFQITKKNTRIRSDK